MNHPKKILNNEDGYMAILASIMFLALLTIIGLAASRTANTEVLMSGNEIRYQRNFYRAEGAAMEAVDILEHTINLKDNLPDWIDPFVGNLTHATLSDYWDNDSSEGDSVIPQESVVDPDHTRFIAGSEQVDPGQGWSLDLNSPTVHALAIYGRCDWNGVSTIKVGYLAIY